MSASKQELDIIKGDSGASVALGQTRKNVLDASKKKSKSSSSITNKGKKATAKEKAKTPSAAHLTSAKPARKVAKSKSSNNTSSDAINKPKKSATNEKTKKTSSAVSEKEKQVSKNVARPTRKSNRDLGDVDYEEQPEERTKKAKPKTNTSEQQAFYLKDDMRVDQKSRMENDFKDFAVVPGHHAFLIHKKHLEKVMVVEMKGAQVLIRKESGGSPFWVKDTQVLGNFDGEIREGRVGLHKKPKTLPTLVEIVDCNAFQCLVKNYNDGDESTGYTVRTDQVSMASPSTLRDIVKEGKTGKKKESKKKLGYKQGSGFDLQTFLKAQAERDEKQRAMFETMVTNQSNQINALIAAMTSTRNASADTSAKEKKGVSKDDASNSHATDDG